MPSSDSDALNTVDRTVSGRVYLVASPMATVAAAVAVAAAEEEEERLVTALAESN